ncbi:MAG: 50S ribosomal protein L21 [Candidatus Neomarinimicrobiota bacterium]
MYAIVNISGKQFMVEPGDELQVPRHNLEPGKKVKYDHVLLVGNDKKIKVGTPSVKGSTVQATVLDHGKTKKVPVFKKKRRKGYRVKNTHRQEFTRIRVDSVKEKAPSKARAPAKKKSTTKTTKNKASKGE